MFECSAMPHASIDASITCDVSMCVQPRVSCLGSDPCVARCGARARPVGLAACAARLRSQQHFWLGAIIPMTLSIITMLAGGPASHATLQRQLTAVAQLAVLLMQAL